MQKEPQSVLQRYLRQKIPEFFLVSQKLQKLTQIPISNNRIICTCILVIVIYTDFIKISHTDNPFCNSLSKVVGQNYVWSWLTKPPMFVLVYLFCLFWQKFAPTVVKTLKVYGWRKYHTPTSIMVYFIFTEILSLLLGCLAYLNLY